MFILSLFLEIPLFHVLTAKITFGNIFARDTAVDGVSTLEDAGYVSCNIDDYCFEPPPGYMRLGKCFNPTDPTLVYIRPLYNCDLDWVSYQPRCELVPWEGGICASLIFVGAVKTGSEIVSQGRPECLFSTVAFIVILVLVKFDTGYSQLTLKNWWDR